MFSEAVGPHGLLCLGEPQAQTPQTRQIGCFCHPLASVVNFVCGFGDVKVSQVLTL